jgi:peptide/nickel transport system substrate-binding protein
MRRVLSKCLISPGLVILAISVLLGEAAANGRSGEELMTTDNAPGKAGGRIVVALRSEPKTLNPVVAVDDPSHEVIRCLTGDLIHINHLSLKTEPALAKSWTISLDGKHYTLSLRRGLRFSDGQPFTADDVTFTFQVYLDENVHSPQRDLLVVGGKPIEVRKIDDFTVQFDLAKPGSFR